MVDGMELEVIMFQGTAVEGMVLELTSKAEEMGGMEEE